MRTPHPRAVTGYDRLARAYRWLEWPAFGGGLQRARVSLLDELPAAERILVLGDGDGRLLAALCQARAGAGAKIVSLDQSPGMLRLQRRRVGAIAGGAAGRVTFVCADAMSHNLEPGAFDLLVTAFFVDCFDADQLRRGLPAWLAAVRPGGHWLVTDFVAPPTRWRGRWARFRLALMHAFFRLQTGCPNRRLVDWRAVATGRDRRPLACRDFGGGMIRSELFELP